MRRARAVRRATTAGLLTTACLTTACRTEPHPGPPTDSGAATTDSAANSAPAGAAAELAMADSTVPPVRLASCAPGAADTSAAAGAERMRVAREVCEMFVHGAAAWTRGDLDGFMGDYLRGKGTSYIGRNRVLYGPAAIRASYAPRFERGGVRDSLSFEDIQVDVLAPGVAHAIAFYVLSRGDSTVARGPTSLVLRKVRGRWMIVHDHSS